MLKLDNSLNIYGENENEMESLTSIFSASTWPNVKSKDRVEKLRTSRLQNWPSFLNLMKIWWSYWFRKKSVRILFSTSVWYNVTVIYRWNTQGVDNIRLFQSIPYFPLLFDSFNFEFAIKWWAEVWNTNACLSGGVVLSYLMLPTVY